VKKAERGLQGVARFEKRGSPYRRALTDGVKNEVEKFHYRLHVLQRIVAEQHIPAIVWPGLILFEKLVLTPKKDLSKL
jgi:hypothetical protein